MRYLRTNTKLGSAKYLLLAISIVAIGASYTVAHTYASKPAHKQTSCASNCVLITNNGFAKSELAVKVGDFVEFRSADGKSHNLALGEGNEHSSSTSQPAQTDSDTEHSHDHVQGTESGTFGADEAWKVQFKKAGTYIIHDHLNPELNILVIAYQPVGKN